MLARVGLQSIDVRHAHTSHRARALVAGPTQANRWAAAIVQVQTPNKRITTRASFPGRRNVVRAASPDRFDGSDCAFERGLEKDSDIRWARPRRMLS